MNRADNIDEILDDWPFDPHEIAVRRAVGHDGRELLQMRIEMGILQLETKGRPDGERPEGADSYYDFLVEQTFGNDEYELTDEQCSEIDREFVQYYHRRVCWLRLQEYDLAVRDADHTLGLMDLCQQYSPDEQWTVTHEQYRPFVLFHRTQASALATLEDKDAEQAVAEVNRGLDRIRDFFEEHEADEQFDEDELVNRLVELRESLRDHYDVGPTLEERLAEAVEHEQYELAAKLRDELAKRQ